MKIKPQEIEIINLCIPSLTEFGEINFTLLSEHIGKKGIIANADLIANIFIKYGFCYNEDCVTITGDVVYQYFLNEDGRMLYNTHSYHNFLAVKKVEIQKRKIRLSRSNATDWLDTKFIKMAAFVLFAVAVYSFAIGDSRTGAGRMGHNGHAKNHSKNIFRK
jgi:hypothetical protein